MKTVREIRFDDAHALAKWRAQSAVGDAAGGFFALAASDADLLQLENSQAGAAGSTGSPARIQCASGIVALRATTLAGGGLAGADAGQRGAALANLKRLMTLAAQLKAGHVSVEPGAVGAGRSYQDALNQTFAAVRDVIPVLERAGVRLCLRVAMRGFLMSPPEMRELLDGFDTSFVGADVDVALGRVDYASAEDWLTTLGGRAFVVGIPQGARDGWRELVARTITSDRIILEREYAQPGEDLRSRP